MSNNLSLEAQKQLIKRGFSRRSFGRFATLLTAGATLPFYNEAAMAQLSQMANVPADAVRINANENPLGPCKEAAEAMHGIIQRGGRYLYEETGDFTKTLADIEGVKPSYIMPFAGSSDPLHRSVLAFCSPTKPLIVADPGYEAAGRAAEYISAKTYQVKLTANYAHDVKAMVAASPNAGMIYICNPNNPSGTTTSRADIEWALANKPAGSILVLDEAYLHFSDQQAGTDFVAKDKDVVVLRTFSKLFGMAGLRAGAAIARPDLLEKLKPFSAGALPVTGMIGAKTSLEQKYLIPQRKKDMRNVRTETFSFLDKHNVKFIASDSNCFMMDAKRPAKEFMSAMLNEKVLVGRAWPSMPTYSRITVGTKEEMAKFQTALLKVMA